MRKLIVLFIVVSLFLLFKNGVVVLDLPKETKPQPAPSATSIPTPIKTELDSDKLWSLIQEWRQSEGLKPYIKDQRLCAIAEDRVDDGDNAHEGFKEKYINHPYVISENATGGYTEQDALKRWLASPSHRKALESNWTYSCVATSGSNVSNNYAVQIFSNF